MKRIFIISDYLMFSRGLESLLSQEAVDIVGQATNIDKAIKLIEETQPDVIIFYTNATPSASAPEIINILERYPDLKVINLNLQDNNLYLHWLKQSVIQGVEDLIAAIEETGSSRGTAV
jgi:DNA-binding NarL/FixJ family response regulator